MNDLLSTLAALLTVLAASVLAVFDALPVLQDALIGAGAGAIVAKLLVRRRERAGAELSARRIRQIEAAWLTALGGVGGLISLIVELL